MESWMIILAVIGIISAGLFALSGFQGDFSEKETFTFTLVSDSSVQDILVTIDHLVSFTLTEFEGEKELTVDIEGKRIASGEMLFILEYTDSLGTKYREEQRETIMVKNVPWWYKIWLSLLSFFE